MMEEDSRKLRWAAAVAVVLAVLAVVRYGEGRGMHSADEVIRRAASLRSGEGQKDYLIEEARAFLRQDRRDDARAVALFILNHIDAGSPTAFQILKESDADKARVAPEAAPSRSL